MNRKLYLNKRIRWLKLSLVALTAMAAAVVLAGCTTTTINEMRQGYTGITKSESIVVLGRRHKSDYETELDFVQCIGGEISGQKANVSVIPEQEFADNLYPWFEPRTAPVHLEGLNNLLQREQIAERITELGIRYIVWVDGSTERTSSAGSIACSIGPGGGGCLGFGTWDDESLYEASIWDFKNLTTVGKIKADAKGTSYMPAVVVPIPLLARVKANACKGLGEQLRSFLTSSEES